MVKQYSVTYTIKERHYAARAIFRIVNAMYFYSDDYSIVQDYTADGRAHWHVLMTTSIADKGRLLQLLLKGYVQNPGIGSIKPTYLGYIYVTDITSNPHKWRMYMKKRNQNKKCIVYNRSHDVAQVIKDVSEASRRLSVPQGGEASTHLPSQDEGND